MPHFQQWYDHYHLTRCIPIAMLITWSLLIWITWFNAKTLGTTISTATVQRLSLRMFECVQLLLITYLWLLLHSYQVRVITDLPQCRYARKYLASNFVRVIQQFYLIHTSFLPTNILDTSGLFRKSSYISRWILVSWQNRTCSFLAGSCSLTSALSRRSKYGVIVSRNTHAHR